MARTKTYTIEERTIGGEKVAAVVEKISSSIFIATLFSNNGQVLSDSINNSMGSAVRWAQHAIDSLEDWVVAS